MERGWAQCPGEARLAPAEGLWELFVSVGLKNICPIKQKVPQKKKDVKKYEFTLVNATSKRHGPVGLPGLITLR